MGKYSLGHAMAVLGVSRAWLAQHAGVCADTIGRLLSDTNPYAVQDEVAHRVAGALGMTVEEIEWPHGISQLGRPAGTGITCARSTARSAKYCTTCGTMIPAALTDCESCCPS